MKKILAFFRHNVSSEGYAVVEPVAAGLSAGIFAGIAIAAYSALCALTGYGIEAETLFEAMLPGYTLTVGGTIVGVVWMFSIGYLSGSILAWLYNKLAKNS